MSDYAIRLQEFTKNYTVRFWRPRSVRALDRLSIAVAYGEVREFMGSNGAGKTATLTLLMQLIFLTFGRVDILGRPAGDVETSRRLGYLPELSYFYDNLTAEELLIDFDGLFGLSTADVPGASWWLRSLAAAGSRESLRMLWLQFYESTDNDWVHGESMSPLAQ
jgi:ABC-type multidrug transport system ATPase subunit